MTVFTDLIYTEVYVRILRVSQVVRKLLYMLYMRVVYLRCYDDVETRVSVTFRKVIFIAVCEQIKLRNVAHSHVQGYSLTGES